jgi:hypothetical protein
LRAQLAFIDPHAPRSDRDSDAVRKRLAELESQNALLSSNLQQTEARLTTSERRLE